MTQEPASGMSLWDGSATRSFSLFFLFSLTLYPFPMP
jgi:hypothetical protein